MDDSRNILSKERKESSYKDDRRNTGYSEQADSSDIINITNNLEQYLSSENLRCRLFADPMQVWQAVAWGVDDGGHVMSCTFRYYFVSINYIIR